MLSERGIAVGDELRSAAIRQVGLGLDGAGRTIEGKTRGGQEFDRDIYFFSGANGLADGAFCGNGESKGSRLESFAGDRSSVEDTGDQRAGSVGKAEGSFGALDLLRGVGGENFEIAERVATVKAMAVEFDVKIGGLGEPKLLMTRAKLNGGIIDGNMFATEADFGDGVEQV